MLRSALIHLLYVCIGADSVDSAYSTFKSNHIKSASDCIFFTFSASTFKLIEVLWKCWHFLKACTMETSHRRFRRSRHHPSWDMAV